jgi:hypothetical protein
MDTKIGQSKKDEVAELGFDAMTKGTGHAIFGAKNKLQVATASVLPSSTTLSVNPRCGRCGPQVCA